LSRTERGVSSKTKNSNSTAASTAWPAEPARDSTRRSRPRGQIVSAASANSARKNNISPSSGRLRQLSGTMRSGASG